MDPLAIWCSFQGFPLRMAGEHGHELTAPCPYSNLPTTAGGVWRGQRCPGWLKGKRHGRPVMAQNGEKAPRAHVCEEWINFCPVGGLRGTGGFCGQRDQYQFPAPVADNSSELPKVFLSYRRCPSLVIQQVNAYSKIQREKVENAEGFSCQTSRVPLRTPCTGSDIITLARVACFGLNHEALRSPDSAIFPRLPHQRGDASGAGSPPEMCAATTASYTVKPRRPRNWRSST
ncbi:uncharacterized protein [Narcine bancroftii]|uniref:uncharacterized protein n=1 Tax=Narcine bancroftii TaxID=1343680 RepID=UPI0038321E5D